ARWEDCDILQLSLSLSPIARSEIQKILLSFFEASSQGVHHSDRPSFAPHQRRFDKIVAENMTSKRLAARQLRQARVLRECAHANDGVVPPIVAFGAVPPRNACGYQRPVQPSRKLLQPGKSSFRIHDDR